MKSPAISIILPTYNVGSTIEKCIQSIINQTYKNIEILVIDGGSEDRTMDIMKGYALSNCFISFVSEKDTGIYDAMNKGIQMAKGEWIYFMGSDDCLIDSEVLASVVDNLKEDDDIVYGNIVSTPGNNVEAGEWDYHRLLNMCINHQRILYRATLFKTYGLFETKYLVSADYDLNIRFFSNPMITKQYINLPITLYHSEGFSSNKLDEIFWNNFKQVMAERFSPYLSKKEIYRRLGFYCWYHIQQKKYMKALSLFGVILFYTRSVDFVKHSLSQLLKSLKS
jgi:glycosyltransferase involved in cell wall biosynthesis